MPAREEGGIVNHVLEIPWVSTFGAHTPVIEIFLRGTVTYLVLFSLLRVIPKREAGAAGITDLLVIVLIADAAQNAMAGAYTSVTDGIVLVSTIVFWAWALNWLGWRVAWIDRLLQPPSLLLVKDGRLLRQNMRKELVTEGELRSQLRLQGIDDVGSVREARMEPDGRISVLRTDNHRERSQKRKVG